MKPLWLLIDGYNVIAPVAGPGRNPKPDWLARERRQFIQRLVDHLPEGVRYRTVVVFDAKDPPSNVSNHFEREGIQVHFAVGYPEADDLLEEIISEHPAAKQLAVVTSDHRIQTAASRRGAKIFDSDPWFDNLVEGRIGLAVDSRKWRQPEEGSPLSEKPEMGGDDVDEWLEEFGID